MDPPIQSSSWRVRIALGAQLAASAFGLVLSLMNGSADLDMWFIVTVWLRDSP